jgi:hypothetical protein
MHRFPRKGRRIKMSKEVKVWGEGREALWSYGESVNIPAHYEYLPVGDGPKTKYVNAHTDLVYRKMEKDGSYSRVVGLWAPKEIVARAEALVSPSSPESRAKSRARSQEREQAKARAEIKRLYPSIPAQDLEAVVERAFLVGSGRVGRSGLLPLEEKCRLAVIAHVRHCHTNYESYFGIKGPADEVEDVRSEARELVRDNINEVLRRWRCEAG